MSDCIWTGSETPRAVRGRHVEDCETDDCRGCQRCTEPHCGTCGRTHVDQQTCASCCAATRDDLRAVRTLTGQLRHHAIVGGSDGHLEAARAIPGGEAMVLMGPGGESGDALPSDPMPSLLLLATWEDAWRHELGQPAAAHLADMPTAYGYLSDWLDVAAQKHPAFDEFASDLRRQVARLEAVLHDGIKDDPAGIECFECGGGLVRKMTDHGMDDRWTCRRCRRRYTDPEYHLAIRAMLEEIREAERADVQRDRGGAGDHGIGGTRHRAAQADPVSG